MAVLRDVMRRLQSAQLEAKHRDESAPKAESSPDGIDQAPAHFHGKTHFRAK
jgi:hypothetical protein